MEVLAHSFGITVSLPHASPFALPLAEFIAYAANRGARHTRWKAAPILVRTRHPDPNP